jgi:hypothetical protein
MVRKEFLEQRRWHEHGSVGHGLPVERWVIVREIVEDRGRVLE